MHTHIPQIYALMARAFKFEPSSIAFMLSYEYFLTQCMHHIILYECCHCEKQNALTCCESRCFGHGAFAIPLVLSWRLSRRVGLGIILHTKMTLHLISNSPVSNQTLICRILLLSFVIWQALRAPLAISPLRSWGRTPTESLWISGPVVRPKNQNNSQMSLFFWQMAGFLHGWFGENIISLNLTPTFLTLSKMLWFNRSVEKI